MTYSVRRLEKEDLDQVSEIDREAFPTQWPPANYRQELQNKIAHYLVLCDDSRTAEPPLPLNKKTSFFHRLFRLSPAPSNNDPLPTDYIVGFSGIWMMADEAHITNIAVRQAYRGNGLGGFLMLATIDLAGELKANFLTLEVRASNLVAQGLYKKYGFVHMGVRRGYYLDNHEDAIIMSTDTLASESFKSLVHELREELKKRLA